VSSIRPSPAPFPFGVPKGYSWLIERGLAGFAPSSALQPWYFLPDDQVFSVSDRWPKADEPARQIIAFARRQDCDDLACFSLRPQGHVEILLVHGWTPDGYEVVGRFGSFWDWLRRVVSDIEEWVSAEAAPPNQ